MAYAGNQGPGVAGQRSQPASTPGRPGQGGGEKRYWNNASKRMETAQQIRNYKAPVNTRVSGAGHAIAGTHPTGGTPAAKPAATPKTPFYGGEIPNIGGLASRLQLQQVGAPLHAAEEGEKASTRLPFQQKNSEIVNTEGNVRNRLEGINNQNNQYLQGLIAGAEGSAKTANNYAAESALSAQKNVETTGQNALTNVGGQFAGNVAATEQRGQANVQAIRTMALAAAAQGQQGLQTAQSRFATEASRNRAAENQALEKVTARGKNARLEAGQKLYTDLLGLKTLEQRGALGAQKNALTAAGLNIKEQQAKTGEFNARTKATQGQEKLNLSAQELNRRWTETNNKAAQNAAHDQYLNASLGEKSAVDQANIKFKEGELKSKWEANWIKLHGGQRAPKQTATTVNKVISEFGRTLGEIESAAILGGKKGFNRTELREALAKGYGAIKIGGKEKAVKTGSVTNRLIIKAAEEVWDKHYVGPQTKAALGALGLPTEGWSEQLKRG